MAKLSIRHPNELSEIDFENLRGTTLMETLVRNRMEITLVEPLMLSSMVASQDSAYAFIHTWLTENCKSNFYIDAPDDLIFMIYIENECELLACKMAFEQEEIPDQPLPPKKPKSSSVGNAVISLGNMGWSSQGNGSPGGGGGSGMVLYPHDPFLRSSNGSREDHKRNKRQNDAIREAILSKIRK